jgi:hypothetical protein
MIPFACQACHKRFSVREDLAGKKGRCPGCGQFLVVPQPAGATQPGGGPSAGLTHFLSPPQARDELGRLGKYRILKVLGHGGMGVVYQAEDPVLKRGVAVKAMLPTLALSPSAGKRFLREAQAMAAVEHDHIVRIYQVDEDRGVPFLAMEFLQGETLAARLLRPEKLPPAEVLRIGREVAEALAAAHERGLIHRDIKPANIWLEARTSAGRAGHVLGRVKILDFGLARAATGDSDLTRPGDVVGTPAFMAPEQARGEAVDARCDLFSLGVVLYRLTTGQQPFRGKDAISTLLEVATHQPPPPAGLSAEAPPGLSDLVMRLLEKEPGRRPASAREVVEVLATLERDPARQSGARADAVAPKAAPPGGAAAPRGRRRLLLVAALLLGVGALGWVLFPRGRGGDAWLATVAAMPAEKQVQAVMKRLQELNPKFDGKEGHSTDGGVVTELEFLTDEVTDVSPVRALVGLWSLKCQGSWAKGRLANLRPLEHLKLTLLYCHNTDVSDLSPLAKMPLKQLNCGYTRVSDLTPLGQMKLEYLYCPGTNVSDLGPLQDMKLNTLHCQETTVTDLSPLRRMPLEEIRWDFKPGRNADILRSIKTLKWINEKPAKKFWEQVDAKKR